MKDFIIANIPNIVFLLCCALAAFWAVKAGYKRQVMRVGYELVCKAEREITGTKKGRERKAQVIKEIYQRLPSLCRLFVSEKAIDSMIDMCVDKMKSVLKTGAEV